MICEFLPGNGSGSRFLRRSPSGSVFVIQDLYMLIADLMKNCPQCNGTGESAGYESVGEWHPNYNGKCPTCEGYGHLLTELGEDLWRLYEPRIRRLFEDVLLNHHNRH